MSVAVTASDYDRWFPPEKTLPPRSEKEPRAAALQEALEAFVLEACRTIDEHDEVNPVKALPIQDQMQYVRYAFWALLREKKLMWGKSRKVSATWAILHYLFWRTLHRPNQRIGWVTQKEGDAKTLITRYIERGLWSTLPGDVKARYELDQAKGHFRILERDHQPWNSEIIAYPSGADQLRQLAHTVIVVDEAHTIPDLPNLLQGSMPGLRGREGVEGGQLVMIFCARRGSYVIKLCGGERRVIPAARAARERWTDGKPPGLPAAA